MIGDIAVSDDFAGSQANLSMPHSKRPHHTSWRSVLDCGGLDSATTATEHLGAQFAYVSSVALRPCQPAGIKLPECVLTLAMKFHARSIHDMPEDHADSLSN